MKRTFRINLSNKDSLMVRGWVQIFQGVLFVSEENEIHYKHIFAPGVWLSVHEVAE